MCVLSSLAARGSNATVCDCDGGNVLIHVITNNYSYFLISKIKTEFAK